MRIKNKQYIEVLEKVQGCVVALTYGPKHVTISISAFITYRRRRCSR